MTELTGLIVHKNAARQIAYGAVLIPNEPDSDYEAGEKLLSAEEIENVAHEWLEKYANVDIDHGLNNVAKPVESYILPFNMDVETTKGQFITIPAGSWILAVKVADPVIWQGIQEGYYSGFSIMGISRHYLNSAKSAEKSADGASLKRTLIADLGDDWIAPFVSIVDMPAVPKAKFFALKSATDEAKKQESPIKRLWSSITHEPPSDRQTVTEKAGRRFSDVTYAKLKELSTALMTLLESAENERGAKSTESGDTMDAEEIKQIVKDAISAEITAFAEKQDDVDQKIADAVKSAIDPVVEQISGLESSIKGKEEEAITKEALDALKSDIESFKADFVDTVSKALSRKSAQSKALTGQDGAGDAGAPIAEKGRSRDSFGRSIKE